MARPDPLEAAGELRAAYDAVDWASTPLGPVEQWGRGLRWAVRLVMETRFPATLLWGPEFVLVYNAAYVQMIGDKHPSALGQPAREVFPEAWSQVGPMMQSVLDGRGATWVEDALVPLERHGFLEDCWFTFSYSPVCDDEGAVLGVVDIVTETSSEVIARRRLAALAALRATLLLADTPEELQRRAVELLREHATDLRAVDVRGPSGQQAQGSGAALGLAPAPLASGSDPVVQETADGPVVWLPLTGAGSTGEAPVLVAAVSERIAFDEACLTFLQLIEASLSQALARIEVIAAERRLARAERAISQALQESLLGDPVEQAGVEIAARYLPASDLNRIGGDWYDTFHGPDGALHLVLGDVAGHDRRAAVLMAQARNLLRGIAYGPAESPARIMQSFDAALSGLERDATLTAILTRAVPDPSADGSLALTWTNAGHPPALLVAPGRPAAYLDEGGGPLVGFAPERAREDVTTTLGVGSLLVLYSDGLVERRGEDLDTSLTRLRTLVDALPRTLSAEEVADRLLDEHGVSEEDDTVLLVVRVVGRPDGA